ncbi:MAG: hypothetical protein ACLFNI_04960 [Natronomonas sp.]
MTSTTSEDPVDRLEEARKTVEDVRENAEPDVESLTTVAEAYRKITTVFDRWEDRATDFDDFEGYVKFRDDLAETLSAIPDSVPHASTIEEAAETVKTDSVTSSLSKRDFEAARDELEPLRTDTERYEILQSARESYRTAYRDLRRRLEELDTKRDDLRRLRRFAEADLDAPVEVLRDPIETYNHAVEDSFASFRRESPARRVLTFIETTEQYPLVPFDSPPEDLLEYVRTEAAGEHTLDELVEFSEYTRSKLDHYVDDADLLKRRIATNRTYVDRLTAEPLTIEWPPPPAAELRFLVNELVSIVDRFAEDETVATLRTVRQLANRDEYEQLRTAAVARDQLTDAERARIEEGTLEADLESVGRSIDRLERVLESAPAPNDL